MYLSHQHKDMHATGTIQEIIIEFTKMHCSGNDYIYINLFDDELRNSFNPLLYPGEMGTYNGNSGEEIRRKLFEDWSSRRFGIGSDGVIIIQKPEIALQMDKCIPNDIISMWLPKKESIDAQMIMYNSDGSRGKMCGNGLRCVARFVYQNLIPQSFRNDVTNLMILTDSGVKICTVFGQSNAVEIDLGTPILDPSLVPINLGSPLIQGIEKMNIQKSIPLTGISLSLPHHVSNISTTFVIYPLSMGNPHCVIMLKEEISPNDESLVQQFPLDYYGPMIESNKGLFPDRVNVEVIEVKSVKWYLNSEPGKTPLRKNKGLEIELVQRTWERGSGETLACGTGAAAASVVASLLMLSKEITTAKDTTFDTKERIEVTSSVKLKGGTLHNTFNIGENGVSPVFQKGDVIKVFQGSITM